MKCSRCGCTVFHENELDKLECETDEPMKEKAKAALKEWSKSNGRDYVHVLVSDAYLAGAEWAWGEALKRSNEIADRDGADYSKLHAENQKLRECVEYYAATYFGSGVDPTEDAVQCLKEIEGE
jgi:hypothetical protein